MSDDAQAFAARLASLPGFEALSEQGRALVSEHARACTWEAGAPPPAADEGDVLALLAGRLAVTLPEQATPVATLESGALFGAGMLRGEDVRLRPQGTCELARLPAQGVEGVLAADPRGVGALVQRVADSERGVQLGVHLARLFPGLDGEALQALGAGVDWVALRGGDWLFREGEPGDAAWLLISGRLRAVQERETGERALNEIAAGETVGEMALLTDAVRSASVYAVRDSQLARLSSKAFAELTNRHPAALRRIAGFVVDRLRRHGGPASVSRTGIALAVVAARAEVDLEAFAGRLAAALAALGSVQHVTRGRVDSVLGRRGIADASDVDPAGMRLVRWMNERDAASDFVLYQGDPAWSAWTERVARHADRVLVVANASDGPGLGPVEQQLEALWHGVRGADPQLALLHSADGRPSGTRAWLAQRHARQHYHLREADDRDFARLARSLTGRGVGLVLGGGGARGFAHLGVLQALEEAGVPIDWVGGTSIGSIIAALPAQGLDAAASREVCRRYISSLFDPTLPVVSLLAGRRIGRRVAEAMGGGDIEDLWLPYFCVATNLSRAEALVQRSGSLFRAVRSSISLPGILPPVTRDGEVFVDGGLLNNLPIDVMQALSGGGPVIAVDVSPDVDLKSHIELESDLSGWRALWQRVRPFGKRLDLPYISSVLMRSALVGSIVGDRERRAAEAASLYLKLPVSDWGLLEFEKLDAIALRGHQASAERVKEWWARRA
jgi:predicted acylesterase/phospholipase RssA/CRP-like cAMP-binding protein